MHLGNGHQRAWIHAQLHRNGGQGDVLTPQGNPQGPRSRVLCGLCVLRALLTMADQEQPTPLRQRNHAGNFLHDDATSICQIAEWGVGTFQIAFPRMTKRVSFEKRGNGWYMIDIAAKLFNLCSNLVGINQIRTTYMPEFVQPAHEEYVNRS